MFNSNVANNSTLNEIILLITCFYIYIYIYTHTHTHTHTHLQGLCKKAISNEVLKKKKKSPKNWIIKV